MQVILFRNIERVGMQGDIVNVAPGYFRNYLGPRGMAAEATEATLRRLELKRKKLQAQAEIQRNEARALAKRLAEVKLQFTRKATDQHKLFGSVNDHDVLEALTQAGFAFERRQILLHDPIKTTGVHMVRIRLEGNLIAEVAVKVDADVATEPQAAGDAKPTAEAQPPAADAAPEAS